MQYKFNLHTILHKTPNDEPDDDNDDCDGDNDDCYGDNGDNDDDDAYS